MAKAKRSKSASASIPASVWDKLGETVKAKGGTEEALRILIKQRGEHFLDMLADFLVWEEIQTRTCFPITVDYSRSISEMIKAAQYVYSNKNITAKNFPVEGRGIFETEVVLEHFDRSIGSEEAIKELAQMGLRPAKIEHLLAFTARRTLLRWFYPIVALGAVWDDQHDHRFVVFQYGEPKYTLDLGWFFGKSWRPHCRFLALRATTL